MTLTTKLMASAGFLALSTGVAAAAPAVAETDLNVRAGPGIGFDVIGAIPAGATVDVRGCRGSWCRVAFGGMPGFASRDLLALGGPAVGRTVVGEGYYEPGYGYGYRYGYDRTPGYSYGYSEGPSYTSSYSYGERRGFRGEGEYGGNRTAVSSGERRGFREGETRGVRENGGNRTAVGGEERGRSQTATEIQGANPMINPKSQAPVARPGPVQGIQGNNPMQVPRSQQAAGANEGARGAPNVRGNTRATTGAGRRESQ